MPRVTTNPNATPCLTERGEKVHATLNGRTTQCGHPVTERVHHSKLITCHWCQGWQDRAPTEANERIDALRQQLGRPIRSGEFPVADISEWRDRRTDR